MSTFNYQPSKSSLRADTVVEFVNRSLLEFKMTEIPGMGPASIDKFKDHGIYTPAQILAKFLSFVHSEDVTALEVCNQFYDWANPIMGKANTKTNNIIPVHIVFVSFVRMPYVDSPPDIVTKTNAQRALLCFLGVGDIAWPSMYLNLYIAFSGASNCRCIRPCCTDIHPLSEAFNSIFFHISKYYFVFLIV